MRTIDKILTFSIDQEQMLYLEHARFCNGCGGEGKNIDKLLYTLIEALPNFDIDKTKELYEDIRVICYLHDLSFYTKQGFTRSNWTMAMRIAKLLHWAGCKRYLVAMALFYTLSRYGYRYYQKK